ncbi:hypothetical protein D3C84_749310 [compost metagenome]
MTNWNSGNFNPAAYQPALGFTPVQQGGGTGQATNKVYIGHRPAMADVGLQVDTTDFGAVWCDTYGVEKVRSAVASFTVGQVGTYGLFKVSGGWPTVPGTWVTGASLVYTDCEGESSHGSPAGSWMLMGGILNADGVADDSVSLFLRGI